MRLTDQGAAGWLPLCVMATMLSCSRSEMVLEERGETCLYGRQWAEEQFDDLGCIDGLDQLESAPRVDSMGLAHTLANRLYYLEPILLNVCLEVRYCELAEAAACPATILEQCRDTFEVEPRNP